MADTSKRRPARGQDLSLDDITLLNSHKRGSYQFLAHVHALYDAGWTLRAIGEAVTPKTPRSTVRNWVEASRQAQCPIVEVSPPVYATTPVYVRKTSDPTPISLSDQELLAKTAPVARKYRAGMPNGSSPHIANDVLDLVVTRLVKARCSVADIAFYAGTSSKAIYKRLDKIRNR